MNTDVENDTQDVTPAEPWSDMFWVGIGASAGGLEALQALMHSLPRGLPATYIIAQHLSPKHRSLLPEIISRDTEFEILAVEDGVEPKRDCVYITPENFDVIVDGDQLRLIEPSSAPAAPKPSVDRFLRSLAIAKADNAVAIILSGTGSDGAHGVREVRVRGGITIAQDENSAKYTGMPISAVETGKIDLVMSPEEIGKQFATVLARPRNLTELRSSPVHFSGMSELIHLIHSQKRVNFRYYKTATLQRRVERRMAALGLTEIQDYVAVARASDHEVEGLFQDFLISVTSFFRDQAEFKALTEQLAPIVESKRENGMPMRVWVAGSATGEEAYSVAIVLSELFGGLKAFREARVQIFATDIDGEGLEFARRGIYPEPALDSMPVNYIHHYFSKLPLGLSVDKVLREKIIFSYHNVAQDPPFINVDLITCRNLLIYFQNNLQSQVLARFHYALNSRGLLFLGKSETVAANGRLFRPLDGQSHLFSPRDVEGGAAAVQELITEPRLRSFNRPRERQPATVSNDGLSYQARFESLVKAMGPDALLIASDMTIIQAFGDVSPFIKLAAGMVKTNVSSLVKPPFDQDIRTAAPVVLRRQIVREGMIHKDEHSGACTRVSLYPVQGGAYDETLALVVFKNWIDETAVEEELLDLDESDTNSAALRRQIEELRRELQVAQTNLQQTVEELETSNEELQALNEELQSSNEELQSTNEELETSNEELQSANEELSTVNEELQVTSNEQRVLNQNLAAVLRNVGTPMLVVDEKLVVTQMSAEAGIFFQLTSTLTLPRLAMIQPPPGFPDLEGLVRQVMDSGEAISMDVGGAVLRVAPNITKSENISGAIILINDNTDAMRALSGELQLIFDSSPDAIFVRDAEGNVHRANQAACDWIGAERQDVEGHNLREFFPDGRLDDILSSDCEVLRTQTPLLERMEHLVMPDGKKRWLRSSRVPANASGQGDKPTLIYSFNQDVTAQYEAGEALRESETRLNQAVAAANIGLWTLNPTTNAFWLSARFRDMLDVAEADLVGDLSDIESRIHPDDLALWRKSVSQSADKPVSFHITIRLQRQQQEFLWFELRGQGLRGAPDEPVGITGAAVDITNTRNQLNELRERSYHLQLAASLAGLGYWRMDTETGKLLWSDQVYDIFGVEKASFVPDHDSALSFYKQDDRAKVEKLMKRAQESGDAFQFEANLQLRDGSEKIVEVDSVVDKGSDGTVNSIFGVIVDQTEQRQREQDLERTLQQLSNSNQELSRFSYVCSHDMKEPVRLIESLCSVLLDPNHAEDEAERNELLQRISLNTARLSSIISGLLAYSRIEGEVEFKSVDLNDVMAEVCDGLNLLLEEKNAKVSNSRLPNLFAAKVHMIQLFQNLIANALKFSDKPHPEVRISASACGGGWEFFVEDNGPGIDEGYSVEVFKVFKRLGGRDITDGSGLGLSICQKIVQQYNGEISVQHSELLGGACFRFTLFGRG